MTSGDRPSSGGAGTLGVIVLAGAAVALGLLEGLPFPVGLMLAVVGVAGSVAWREVASPPWTAWAVVPAILAISVEVILARSTPLAELLSGATGVAFLFWIADDPSRPVGGIRRAVAPVTVVAVAVGFSLSIVVVLPRGTSEVGVAGGLLALAMALLAVLLARTRFEATTVPNAE